MCLKVTKPDGSHTSEEGAASLKAESVNVKEEQGEMKPGKHRPGGLEERAWGAQLGCIRLLSERR